MMIDPSESSTDTYFGVNASAPVLLAAAAEAFWCPVSLIHVQVLVGLNSKWAVLFTF